MIKKGMIVRYNPNWCTPGERKYLHLVKENFKDPCTGEMTRWLIATLNGGTFLPTTEVVDEEMIEPTGFNIEDYLEAELKGEAV